MVVVLTVQSGDNHHLWSVHTHTHTHTHTCTFPGGGGDHPAGAMSQFVAATAIPFIQPFQDDVEDDGGVSC